MRREIVAAETLELGTLIAGDEERTTVLGEAGTSPGNLLTGLWRHAFEQAGLEIEAPEVALVDGDVFRQQNRGVVRRPVAHAPAASGELEHQLVAGGSGGCDDIEISVLAVAPRGRVGEASAAVRRCPAGIPRLTIGEQRHFPIREIVAVKLEKFSAAGVLREDEIVAGLRLEGTTRNWVGEEGKLLARATGCLHQMQLGGICEARREEHFAPLGMPAVERGSAELKVTSDVFAKFGRDGGNAFDDEVLGNLCGHGQHGGNGERGGQKHRAHDESELS